MTENELFREVQPMHQNMIIRIVMPIEMVVMAAVILPLALGPARHQWVELLLMYIAFGVVLPLMIMTIRLVTVVTDRRVLIRYRPFPGREIDAASIRSAQALKYNPLLDAGGWGWRVSAKFHRVFNVSGDRGVHIRYGERKKDQFLVGSRRAEELAEAIELSRFAASEGANKPA